MIYRNRRKRKQIYRVFSGIICYNEAQELIAKETLDDKIELGGTFCIGKYRQGVCVTVDGAFFSVSPEIVFFSFNKEIKAKV